MTETKKIEYNPQRVDDIVKVLATSLNVCKQHFLSAKDDVKGFTEDAPDDMKKLLCARVAEMTKVEAPSAIKDAGALGVAIYGMMVEDYAMAMAAAKEAFATPATFDGFVAGAGMAHNHIHGQDEENHRLLHNHEEPESPWAEFMIAELRKAHDAGNCDDHKIPHFEAQVVLLGGHNLGVGMVAPMETGPLFVLRQLNPNPRKPKQMIATESYFALNDILTIAKLEATAEDKPVGESSIIMG